MPLVLLTFGPLVAEGIVGQLAGLQDLSLAGCTKMDISTIVNILTRLPVLTCLSLEGWEMATLPEGVVFPFWFDLTVAPCTRLLAAASDRVGSGLLQ